MKDTTKLVTDVPFPALTLCGSGLHMNNVEKKLIEDFRDWQREKMRNQTNKEAIEKDMREFMETRFQIKPRDQPINILDILDMMISPDVDASLAANGVRENEIACKLFAQGIDDHSGCSYFCSDPNFSLANSSNQCFHVSTSTDTRRGAKAACQSMGADLASISTTEEDDLVWTESGGGGNVWIGLYKGSTGTWSSPDGTTDAVFNNWDTGTGQPSGDSNCAAKMKDMGGKWNDYPSCDARLRYACSMAAEESWACSKGLEKILRNTFY